MDASSSGLRGSAESVRVGSDSHSERGRGNADPAGSPDAAAELSEGLYARADRRTQRMLSRREFCAPPYAQQYQRHGYACVLLRGRYRLLRNWRVPNGSALAEIGGERVCLRPGARCGRARAGQYRRYGYACVLQKGKYRLVHRRRRGV